MIAKRIFMKSSDVFMATLMLAEILTHGMDDQEFEQRVLRRQYNGNIDLQLDIFLPCYAPYQPILSNGLKNNPIERPTASSILFYLHNMQRQSFGDPATNPAMAPLSSAISQPSETCASRSPSLSDICSDVTECDRWSKSSSDHESNEEPLYSKLPERLPSEQTSPLHTSSDGFDSSDHNDEDYESCIRRSRKKARAVTRLEIENNNLVHS
ncbi:uncharacterized protein BYT42DRAFT_171251 [Radiomyces spectabilis]|uniref:uncharacterized protein n=1 Tax=Radiomyces spectabilis TaxID=64574 RepID=UPI00222052DF|nr:uncharacterized protein BYT42DRAFT_171251 [Radiomyces spectabilis]KAI8390821.1 hypothetical protein BYT42DRAFT_171251 [Radiomyces spectabilis]